MLNPRPGEHSPDPFWVRARSFLRRAFRGEVPHDLDETNDPPVVGRRVTDEQGQGPRPRTATGETPFKS
jgi:hypothetical protein